MGILNTAKANSIKRKIEKALPDLCAVTRVTRVVDPLTGTWTDSDATLAAGIPCRVDKSGLTPREYPVADRMTAVAQFVVMLSTHPSRWPGGVVDLLASDILVITGEAAGRYEPIDSGGPVTDDLVRQVPANRLG